MTISTYTATSPVNTYSITPKGYISNDYDIVFAAGTLTVTQNKFAAPDPGWSVTAPGTVNWNAIGNIGSVAVSGYEVELYKEGTATPVDTTTVTSNSCNLLSTIRSNGAGSYTVKVKAVASTDHNSNKVNVADSDYGTTATSLYAAEVEAKFAEDTVTTAGKGNAISVNNSASYVMVAGESEVPMNATLKNATGYRIKSCTSSETGLTISGGTVSGTGYSSLLAMSSSLNKTDKITITLSLEARVATLSASMTSNPDTGSVVYGYASNESPVLTVNAGVETGDNVAANQYDYEYKWFLKIGDGNKNQQTETTNTWTFPHGQAAGSGYKVSCEVKATRKDNGASKTSTAEKTIVVQKAPVTATVSLTGWVHGEAGNTPTVSSNPGNATVDYLYSTSNTTGATWVTQKPTEGGDYYVKAKIHESSNYGECITPAVAFTITGESNSWTTEPSLADWVYGASAKTPAGAAKYGSVQFTYSKQSTGTFEPTVPSDAGIWYMKAKVPGTNSYGELEQVVSFRIFNASQNAPSGLTARNVTVDGKSNGAINGITAGMEYRKDGENTYTALTPEMISNGKITGIAEGTYYVRYAAKTNYDAGTDTQITVGCDVRLKMSVPAFAEVTQGYAQPQAQSLILTAEGIADAQIVSIVSSKPAEFEIIGSDTTVTAGGTLTTYTVRPMAGLPAGTHSATITVTYNTGITTESATVTGTVSMVVKAKTSGGSQDSNQGEEQPTQETVTASPAQTEEKKPVATATSEPMSSGQENGEGTSNDSEKGNVKENQNPEEEVLPVPTSEPTADDENIQQDWGNIIVVIESPEEAELKLTAELPSKTQVINACLSEEEKKAVERGENIEIRLTIKRIEKEVPVQDKELVEEQVQELASQIDGLTIGKYLDIKLDKRFNGGEWIGISEAAEDIDIIIDIPPELQFPDTQYYISRVHQGKAQLLYDLDEDEKTITISTKYFSTYALLYEAKEPASESICYWHFAILAALLIYLILALLIRDKKRGKCRIWLLGLDGALAIVFAILGSCSLDWPFAIGNIVIATCLTPNLLLKCKKEQEDEKQETE